MRDDADQEQPKAGGTHGSMVQVPTSMRPDSTVPFFVVLWEANSRPVSEQIACVQTAPGCELTIVKNPPLCTLTTPSCLWDRPSEAWEAGRIRVAFLVSVFQL